MIHFMIFKTIEIESKSKNSMKIDWKIINRNNPHNYLKNRNRHCNSFQIQYNGKTKFQPVLQFARKLVTTDRSRFRSKTLHGGHNHREHSAPVLNRFNFVKSTREATTINSCGTVWTFKANFWDLTPSWIGDHWYTRRRVNSFLLYPPCFSKKGRNFDDRNYE